MADPTPPTGGLHRNLAGRSTGKFIVLRARDGSTPDWPSFILGAKDPAAPAALRAYAVEAEVRGFDRAYVTDVVRLAAAFEAWQRKHGGGRPDELPPAPDEASVQHHLFRLGRQFERRRIEALVRARFEEADAAAEVATNSYDMSETLGEASGMHALLQALEPTEPEEPYFGRCPACATPYPEPACGICEREAMRSSYEAMYQAREAEQHATEAWDAERRAIPGVAALEDLLGVEVTFEGDLDGDECGARHTGLTIATVKLDGVLEGTHSGAACATSEEAVRSLREELVKELRCLADELEET